MLERELFRLVHHVDTAAGDVELPAVIDAAQPALLVASEEERDAPVRAELVEESDAAVRVSKRHQVFAQELDAHGRTIGLRKLRREQRRDPVTAHGVSHRRSGTNAGDELVLFVCQHGALLCRDYTCGRSHGFFSFSSSNGAM